ncbi:uncharacterized protein LOC115753352 isoform X3 [Rhodamnia argentea]|uniref:Uncharacterized protein LOC115753352 isoform X3 n=1 Tax=Rhodamnia argentea TaxID=178133 RepID=A0ABM3GSZ1_9MYRT|nr:uncharacterized protein LOC115753352 isoform X3 [Rhodamnia argentea]
MCGSPSKRDLYRSVEMTRHVSMISITLSTKELNMNSPGYQAPLHMEQAKPQTRYQQLQPQQRRTHMVGEEAGVEGEGGAGTGEDTEITKMDTFKIIVAMQTGTEEVAKAEAGATVALGMKGAGVEGAEAMDVVMEGWVVDLEVAATRRSRRSVSSSK